MYHTYRGQMENERSFGQLKHYWPEENQKKYVTGFISH